MFERLTDDEIKASDDRRAFLYQSRYPVDNLTAILMDTTVGAFGLYEDVARAKAHKILDWLAYSQRATVAAGTALADRDQ